MINVMMAASNDQVLTCSSFFIKKVANPLTKGTNINNNAIIFQISSSKFQVSRSGSGLFSQKELYNKDQHHA